MTTGTIAEGTPRLDVVRVLNSTANVFLRRAPSLLLLGLPFVWLPDVVASLNLPKDVSDLLAFALWGLSLVFVGGASLITYRELSGGEPVGFRGAVAVGVRRWFTSLRVGFLCVGPAALGVLFFVVPGIAFMTTCLSAFSIAIVEDKKPIEAFTASQTLSKGSRWQIARLLGVAALTVAVFFGAALAAAAFAIGPLGEANADRLWRLVLRPTVDFLAYLIITVGSAATYTALRNQKDDLASTFD